MGRKFQKSLNFLHFKGQFLPHKSFACLTKLNIMDPQLGNVGVGIMQLKDALTLGSIYTCTPPLQKHVRKVVGGFGKKSYVSTGVRKPGNTMYNTDHYDMT